MVHTPVVAFLHLALQQQSPGYSAAAALVPKLQRKDSGIFGYCVKSSDELLLFSSDIAHLISAACSRFLAVTPFGLVHWSSSFPGEKRGGGKEEREGGNQLMIKTAISESSVDQTLYLALHGSSTYTC